RPRQAAPHQHARARRRAGQRGNDQRPGLTLNSSVIELADTDAPPPRAAIQGAPMDRSGQLDEDAWDDLLTYIEERRVIPIVGPELLEVQTDSGPRLLYDWLAEKLAAKLGVPMQDVPPPWSLDDVVNLYIAG